MGDKLEEASEKLDNTKTNLKENAHQGFAEVKLTDRPPAGDGSCRRMDFLAEEDTAAKAGLAETCIKPEIPAEQPEGAERSRQEQEHDILQNPQNPRSPLAHTTHIIQRVN